MRNRNIFETKFFGNEDNIFEFNATTDEACILVIFGGTGDLTRRKLMPALYNLQCEGMLSDNFAVVGLGRRHKTPDEYINEIYEGVKDFSRLDMDDKKWRELASRIYYFQMDLTSGERYEKLNSFLQELDKRLQTKGNRVYYMAVAPELFEVIVDKLDNHGMAENKSASWRRVVTEKPFGRDLKSARYLNRKITSVFTENNTFRIDHYLGKEMLQNIMVIRFANMLFEPVWYNQFIDCVQISSSERVGVENRGGYYEQSGALRDMVQNHMLQLLTLTAMEPPVRLDVESIRDEKVKVLRSLEQLTPDTVFSNVVRGQYGAGITGDKEIPGYRQEPLVSPESTTETFIALKANVENFRWAGVPFYIRTGKRMPVKSTEIIIKFKPLPKILYFKKQGELSPNILVIRIQPKEGIFFQFNAKKPGTAGKIVPVQMDFCQNCQAGINSPEAYERLLFDVMRGDTTLFTRWDEVEYSWKFVDAIAEAWVDSKPDFPNYKGGTWGPQRANELLERENRRWINLGDIINENL